MQWFQDGKKIWEKWFRTNRSLVFGSTLFLTLSTYISFFRYLRISNGLIEKRPDVNTTWLPVAEAIFSGTPLYLGDAIDNKPPLFEYINILVAATDHYLIGFLLLVAVSNASIAVLLWNLHSRRGQASRGFLSGLLFLLLAPLVNGHGINVRSFMLVGVLFALTRTRPTGQGVGLAFAASISQYAVFTIPSIIYSQLKSTSQNSQIFCIGMFFSTFIFFIAVVYSSVWVVWGEDSFWAALYWSVGFAQTYVFEWDPSLWNKPQSWARIHTQVIKNLVVLIALSIVGIGMAVHEFAVKETSWSYGAQELVLLAVFTAPLIIRALPIYWMYVLPWLCSFAALGALGVMRLVANQTRIHIPI
jgi:hypothetical protein